MVSLYKRKVLKELFELLRDYNTHYGEIEIYKGTHKIYIKIYNGCWGENEALESNLEYLNYYKAIDIHPCKVFYFLNYYGEFNKILTYFNNWVSEEFEVELEWGFSALKSN